MCKYTTILCFRKQAELTEILTGVVWLQSFELTDFVVIQVLAWDGGGNICIPGMIYGAMRHQQVHIPERRELVKSVGNP